MLQMMHQGPPHFDFHEPLDGDSARLEMIDQQILQLLSKRFAMARYLPDDRLDDEELRRKSMTAIRRKAFELGIPVSLVTDFWDRMFDAADAMRGREAAHRRAAD